MVNSSNNNPSTNNTPNLIFRGEDIGKGFTTKLVGGSDKDVHKFARLVADITFLPADFLALIFKTGGKLAEKAIDRNHKMHLPGFLKNTGLVVGIALTFPLMTIGLGALLASTVKMKVSNISKKVNRRESFLDLFNKAFIQEKIITKPLLASHLADTAQAIKSNFVNSIDYYDCEGLDSNTVKKTVEEFLGANASKLFGGCNANQEARVAFIHFMCDRIYQQMDNSAKIDKPPIPIYKFLGDEGVKLYKAALEEEYLSENFRAAVCLDSIEDLGSPIIPATIIIGGPSASGKTSATKKLIDELKEGVHENGSTKLLTIDGSIERKFSQMAQLLLQVAHNKGYQGVIGLEEHSSTPIKEFIFKAAKNNSKISLVIPLTFALEGAASILAQGALKVTNSLKTPFKRAKKTRTQFIYAEVRRGGDSSQFQTAAAVMGNKRAWEPHNKSNVDADTGQIKPPSPNNRTIKSESKAYHKEYFKMGLKGSKAVRKAVISKKSKPKRSDMAIRLFSIKNDLASLHKTNDHWTELSLEEADLYSSDAVLISQYYLDIWNGTIICPEQHLAKLNECRSNNDLKDFAEFCLNNIPLPRGYIRELDTDST